MWEQPPDCRSGLVSRMGREAAPAFSYATKSAGAAAQPFRDARPLLQRQCKFIPRTPLTHMIFPFVPKLD
ncbi:hypothetical protein EI693_16720 [Pseudomonas oryziphila]|uniref:Uncharacterized protein n=1 Tax=Pseudomonas oryziphila TaxID=2894079 RepID=A0ABM7CT41_9PSED|nr:hypothetical protein EI693_16720 [Pseudomonas oryziphila]